MKGVQYLTMIQRVFLATVGGLLTTVAPALACYAISGSPATWLREADTVVRVWAMDAQTVPGRFGIGETSEVRFGVVEVLKGPHPGLVMIFKGELTREDDRNDRPVPYDFVRPNGRGGSCYARNYKRSGEYLLMLRRINGALTPYWAPLGATNEQLFGPDDPWLAWVRQRVSTEKM